MPKGWLRIKGQMSFAHPDGKAYREGQPLWNTAKPSSIAGFHGIKILIPHPVE